MNAPNAVAVWNPADEAKLLTKMVRAKRSQIADLLGADPDTERGKSMIDRFVSVALHAATSDPKILRATKESIVQSIRDSALLGLEPVGITGDGAIVVYDERVKVERPGRQGGTIIVEERVPTAHFQPMYRGLLKLARRSDQLAHIDAHVVYAGDAIELDLGSSPSVRHTPVLDGSERGAIVGAYAVAETKEGRRYVEWMSHADIEVVRKTSRAGQSGPWVDFWPEMARKTVLRRLMKRLPLETMAEHGLRLDSEAEPKGAVVIDDSPPPTDARRRLRSRFGKDDATIAPEEPLRLAEPVPDPEPTSTAEAAPPAVSVDPTGSDQVVEVEVETQVSPVSALCGATSDPQLGPEEVCTLPAGHAFPDGAKSAHQSKEGSRWPNR